ncbi:MAG: PilZ domain-containing protein [Nitrospirota bacterium]|nr:PilZ domain-containing protein [Nitrospirota bacterium]
MEKRVHERYTVNLQARLFYGNIIYTGVVANLSEGGMFISTKINFPVDVLLLTVILNSDDTIKVPVKVKRIISTDSKVSGNNSSGIGVELFDPQHQQDFLNYVRKYKASGTASVS